MRPEVRAPKGGPKITPYELMVILNPEAQTERQEEILTRVRTLVTDGGGTVDHVNEWGRRKIAYPIAKQQDGQFVVLTCQSTPAVLDEIQRVLSINKDVVLRSNRIRLSRAMAESALAEGSPPPVDEPREPDSRPRGGGRGGGGGGGRRRTR